MEIKNPNHDIINLSLCRYYYIDHKNKKWHRCKKIKTCALACGGEKSECPNLENLLKKETDFFKDFSGGNYKTTEHQNS